MDILTSIKVHLVFCHSCLLVHPLATKSQSPILENIKFAIEILDITYGFQEKLLECNWWYCIKKYFFKCI